MMRRIVLCTAMAAATLVALAAAPAGAATGGGAKGGGATAGVATGGAASGEGGGGWERWPSASFDLPAGARCDFPVHLEPVVDQVLRRVLEADADGTVRRAAFKGALVMRLTNTVTGAWYDADAGGRSVVDYRPDGSQTWRAHGPILLGFAEHRGNLPRDLYTVDGSYTVDIDATGYRTLTMRHGTAEPLCRLVG
ncbi:hypothetical protein ACFVHB_21505 [Kitasatospora sp. NPDC127111]|uniref:hypothetical protein n=1 Tax=Kitasatospora sp. NPDC127111 TaxID=3345363 RepID=UPI003634B209